MKGLLVRLKDPFEQGETTDKTNDVPRRKAMFNNFMDNRPRGNSVVFDKTKSTDENDQAIKIVRKYNTKSVPSVMDASTSDEADFNNFGEENENREYNESDEKPLFSDSDTEDVNDKKVGSTVPKTNDPWSKFSDSIKRIDNQHELFIKKPKPNFVSSGTFQQTMADMYGKTDYTKAKHMQRLKERLSIVSKVNSMTTHAFGFTMDKQTEKEADERKHEEPKKDKDETDGSNTITKECARRGWKVLKRDVQETVLKHKTSDAHLAWSILQQHFKGMSDMEKTRYELYQRYGVLPIIKPDGTSVLENTMLSDRAKANLSDAARTGRIRPRSYQPPSSLRKEMKNVSKKTVTFKREKKVVPGNPKIRPSTAVQ
ncbi:hypothetical protein CHS0354_029535 [Potamilus streckersoni]|uniref:Uncharacterized protein n=1 Tax=Potamilus streckersoni TaxID=2493646 RepID=A0AAE0SZ94_9BIVA|nr:hypothetical protein CHS0354_029535 [Potamilus streckersoni]